MTDRWPEIDEHILEGRNIPALVILREEFGYSLHEAIDALNVRWSHHRA
ncbi:hypothetical protein [Actinoallomurus acanthiterrae]